MIINNNNLYCVVTYVRVCFFRTTLMKGSYVLSVVIAIFFLQFCDHLNIFYTHHGQLQEDVFCHFIPLFLKTEIRDKWLKI